MVLHDEGQWDEAESQFRQALAIYDKSLPASHPYRAAALMHLARLLVDLGRAQEALPLSEQSVAIWSADFPASHPPAAQARAIHAYALSRLGRRREAADELATAVPILLAARGPDDPSVRRAEDWWASVRGPASPPTASAASALARLARAGRAVGSSLRGSRKSCRPDSRSLPNTRTAARSSATGNPSASQAAPGFPRARGRNRNRDCGSGTG